MDDGEPTNLESVKKLSDKFNLIYMLTKIPPLLIALHVFLLYTISVKTFIRQNKKKDTNLNYWKCI